VLTQKFVIPGSRLAQQHAAIQTELDQAVAAVIRRAVFTPGPEVEAFEAEFASYIGVKYAIGVSSGSAAVLLALKSLGLQPGDEVISTPQVDISASAPVTQAGGRLVWVDIHPRTYNLDPEQLAPPITPRTRAIVVAHMYGNPADMQRILAIAGRHGLPVIEDAALAVGATCQERQVGSGGTLGCFSFSPGKILGAFGKAGMVVTNDAALTQQVRMWSSYGFDRASLEAIERGKVGAQFEYRAEGFNARLDELQAAVLRVKLRHLDSWIRRRRENARLYRELLADLEPEHLLLPQDTLGAEPAFRLFVIRLPQRDRLMRHLAEAGIWSGLNYVPPLHLQPIYHYLGYHPGDFPQTELVARELLCLPAMPELSGQEIEQVGERVRQFFKKNRRVKRTLTLRNKQEKSMSNEKPTVYIAFAISTRPQRPAEENPIYRGAQIAIDELKQDASLPVALDWKVFDDFGDTNITEKLAREIAADPNIIGVVGPMGSNEAFASAPIYQEAGLVQISPCASHPDLCQRGYQTFFRLVANENGQGNELARMAYGYLQASCVAIIHADDAWAATTSDIFAHEYEKLGGQIVGWQKYPNGGDDFSQVIQATVAAQPELVFCAVHPREGVLISEGLRQAGLKVPFLGTDAMKTTFPLGGGEPEAEAYHTYSGVDFRRLPSAAAFRQAYTARFPEDSTYSPEAYDAIMIVAEALRRAGGPDRRRILVEVRNLRDYQGVSGLINFSPTGERAGAPISFYHVVKSEQGRMMAYLGTTLELLPSEEVIPE
jgi:dTDP-4-amino-4,6-dideoxygalactose transaminase/ABC-type branched-subunit amino acid transport system substrate-binding protein